MDSALMAINMFGPSMEKEKLFSALFQKLFHCVALSVAANTAFDIVYAFPSRTIYFADDQKSS
jgi:hypothetical protein